VIVRSPTTDPGIVRARWKAICKARWKVPTGHVRMNAADQALRARIGTGIMTKNRFGDFSCCVLTDIGLLSL